MPRYVAPKRRILNCVPSQNTEEDWGLDQALQSETVSAPGPLPGSIDLREPWWDVGDQMQTGSCVGWATADSLARWHLVKLARIAEADHLSVRYVWMAAKETDEFTTRPTTFIEVEGTSLKTALDVARRYGLVLEAVLPFNKAQLYPGDSKTFYALASKLRINAYFNLGTDPHAWRTWLATQGPILTRLNVDRTWDDATSTAGNLDVYLPNTTRGGHAVALAGYTADRFIVRNSWGTPWGDQGYGYASIAYAQDAFTEAYGITVY
jgi:Papain family cysteine protease